MAPVNVPTISEPEDPLLGHPGHLNEEQETALEGLKSYLSEKGVELPGDPPIADDASLLRFLRARSFDLEKTKQMYDKYLKWRQDSKVTELRDTFDPILREKIVRCWPSYFHKTDKEGRPICVQTCAVDTTSLYKLANNQKLVENFAMSADCITTVLHPACTRALREKKGNVPDAIDCALIIMDMSNFSLGTFWTLRGFLRTTAQHSQDYFPEGTGAIYIINAPSVFTTIFGFVKGWLDERTTSKVKIMGSNFLPTLLEAVDAENLPRNLGGSCKDCRDCTKEDWGPWKGELPWDYGGDLTDSQSDSKVEVRSALDVPLDPVKKLVADENGRPHRPRGTTF